MSKRIHTYHGFRKFFTSRVGANMEKPKPITPNPADPPTSNSTGVVKMNFAPTELDKKILVWSGRYKSKSEIPSRISYDTIDHARSRLRIKMANVLILGTVLLCGYYVYRGKKSQREGDTIRKRAQDRDQKMLEEYRKRKEKEV